MEQRVGPVSPVEVDTAEIVLMAAAHAVQELEERLGSGDANLPATPTRRCELILHTFLRREPTTDERRVWAHKWRNVMTAAWLR